LQRYRRNPQKNIPIGQNAAIPLNALSGDTPPGESNIQECPIFLHGKDSDSACHGVQCVNELAVRRHRDIEVLSNIFAGQSPVTPLKLGRPACG
jgi:hypothetical protein